MASRILIVSSRAGMGHIRAATALEQALTTSGHPDFVHVNILDYASPLWQWVYNGYYLLVSKYVPWLWGWVYRRTYKLQDSWLRTAHVQLDLHNVRAFTALIHARQPDAVVCTHFLPLAILQSLKRRRLYQGKVYAVITDFDAHGFWLNDQIDHYFVAADITKRIAERHGVDAAKITVTGIPVGQPFWQLPAMAQARDAIKQTHSKPIVLIVGTGMSRTKLLVVMRTILESTVDLHCIFVAGRDQQLARFITDRFTQNQNLTVAGFVPNLQDYMVAADVMVTKAGGLTISEALCTNTAIIVTDPIPGQEEVNATYLREQGAILHLNDGQVIGQQVIALLQHPDQLEALRSKALSLSKPDAAVRIVEAIG